jgi:hypothetical protein
LSAVAASERESGLCRPTKSKTRTSNLGPTRPGPTKMSRSSPEACESDANDETQMIELRPEREIYVGRRVLYGGSFWHAASHWGVMVRQPGADWYDWLFEVVGDVPNQSYLVKSKAGPMKFKAKPFLIAEGGLLSTHGIHEGCISGITNWTDGELQNWVVEYERRYPAYDLFNNNCQHFVEAFCNASVQGTPFFPDLKETSKFAMVFQTITSLGSTAVALHLAFMDRKADGGSGTVFDDGCGGRTGRQQRRGPAKGPTWRSGASRAGNTAAASRRGAQGGAGGSSVLTLSSELDLIHVCDDDAARGQWLVSRTERTRRQRERERERERERCVVS